VWLSVDPASDLYSSLSPYNYCAYNPVFFKDPDGEKIIIHYMDNNGELQDYEYGSGKRVPNSMYARRTIRTLNKIQRMGRDKMGVVSFFAKSENVNFEISESHVVGSCVPDITGTGKSSYSYDWNQKVGGTNKEGEKKYKLSPALLLLHEIAEAYYAYNDPEGKLAELREWQKMSSNDYDSYEEYLNASILWLNDIVDREQKEVGKYDSYGDKWIINNVEPAFQNKSRGTPRDTHSGVYMHIKGGTFSTREDRHVPMF